MATPDAVKHVLRLDQVQPKSLHVLRQNDWTNQELLTELQNFQQKHHLPEMTIVWKVEQGVWYPLSSDVVFAKIYNKETMRNERGQVMLEVAWLWQEEVFCVDFGTDRVLFLTPNVARALNTINTPLTELT